MLAMGASVLVYDRMMQLAWSWVSILTWPGPQTTSSEAWPLRSIGLSMQAVLMADNTRCCFVLPCPLHHLPTLQASEFWANAQLQQRPNCSNGLRTPSVMRATWLGSIMLHYTAVASDVCTMLAHSM